MNVRKKFLKIWDLKKRYDKSNLTTSHERKRSDIRLRESHQEFGGQLKLDLPNQPIQMLPQLKIPLKSKLKD